MPAIYDTLPDHIKQKILKRALTTSQVLNRVMETFRQNQRLSPRQKLNIPIAITVSKSDLLKFAAAGRQSPLFLHDNYLTNRLDVAKLNYIDREVRALLQAFGDRVLLRSAQLFEDVSFFAVSATGWSPDDQNHFPPLEPIRCLDPLLWALWRLGIINLG